MIAGDERVLVTGAAGFIGSAVAASLAVKGFDVVGCDNFNDYYTPTLKRDRVEALLRPVGVRCVPAELSDPGQVEEVFRACRPELVVHLAAQAGVRYSLENPSAYIQSNLVAFANILEACRRSAVRHLLYASSSSVYGASASVPFHEDDRTDEPLSLYAATKMSNELLAYCYSHLYQLPATGLRFFTVYGPWGRPDMAYFSFTRKMLAGETIPVFAGGRLERDFTYIDDVVESVVRLLCRPQEGTHGVTPHTVFNIGNHQPVRVSEFIKVLEGILGTQARIDFLPMQQGDVPSTFADTRRLCEVVGFVPSTPLVDGLSRFVKWYRNWSDGEQADS